MIVDSALVFMFLLAVGNVFAWELNRRARLEVALHKEREGNAQKLIADKNAEIDAGLDREKAVQLEVNAWIGKYQALEQKIAERAKDATESGKKRPPTIPEWRAKRKKVSEGEVAK